MLRRFISIRKLTCTPNPTKEALRNHTHNLMANNIYCCGTGCIDCACLLYLDSLEEYLKAIESHNSHNTRIVFEELDKKLKGTNL